MFLRPAVSRREESSVVDDGGAARVAEGDIVLRGLQRRDERVRVNVGH